MVNSHYNEEHCTPFINNKLKYSCLSRKALRNIAKATSKLHNIKIDIKNMESKSIYDKICTILEEKYNCKTEGCWMGIKELMRMMSSSDLEYFQELFRPKLPDELVKDKTEWLSNFDIENVLSRHQNHRDDFYFYGALPIDFRKCSVSKDLCKINMKKHRRNNETKLGFVFNTDESNKPGQHWFAMYVDMSGINLEGQPGIYFFDSFGAKPNKEVLNLINKIKSQDTECDYLVTHNDKSIQKNTYSCGVYCIHFIEHMLFGHPFKKYLNSVNDKKVKQYLDQCYLHPKEIKC